MQRTLSHAFANQILVCFVATLCVGGTFGLGTVWLRQQSSLAAKAAKDHELRIVQIERRIAATNAAIAAEENPDALERRNREFGLNLVLPAETQVVRVPDDIQQRLAQKRDAELYPPEQPVRFSLSAVDYRAAQLSASRTTAAAFDPADRSASAGAVRTITPAPTNPRRPLITPAPVAADSSRGGGR